MDTDIVEDKHSNAPMQYLAKCTLTDIRHGCGRVEDECKVIMTCMKTETFCISCKPVEALYRCEVCESFFCNCQTAFDLSDVSGIRATGELVHCVAEIGPQRALCNHARPMCVVSIGVNAQGLH